MQASFTCTLALAVAAAAALLSATAGADAAAPERPAAADCGAAPRESAPVADDPRQPLDPLDPQFAQKLAQRYRQLESSGACRDKGCPKRTF